MSREGRYQTTDARALWFCVEDGAVVPIEARDIHDRTHGPARPTLAELQQRYLEVRQHTPSTAGLPLDEKLIAQARYVLCETWELLDAVEGLAVVDRLAQAGARAGVRHEIADVVISATVLAGYLGTSVEACIAEKTEADRGRG